MSKKSEFIKYVETLIQASNNSIEMNEEAHLYWESLHMGDTTAEKPVFTENGKSILEWMRKHTDTPMVKAKEVAEGMGISSRAASGAMRKLVSDGFIEKIGQDPIIYVLTEKGKNFEIV